MELPFLKWTHKLLKSKKELKVKTPKRPRTKFLPCGCYSLFDHEKHVWNVVSKCFIHQEADKAKKELKKIKKTNKNVKEKTE